MEAAKARATEAARAERRAATEWVEAVRAGIRAIRGAELVKSGALLVVAQEVVGGLDVDKLFLGTWLFIGIRVELFRKLGQWAWRRTW